MKKLFSTIRKSLKGEERDYTQGDIQEAVILLAVPMILELGLESVFAVVDMFFVSGLGANAIATVGLTEAVVTLVYSVAMGVSAGATAIVARRIGEKSPEAAGRAGAQAIVLSVAASVVITLIGLFFSHDILRHMGASPEVVAEGSGFTKILIAGNLPILLLFLINGIFRGAGDAAIAMKSLWTASGVNIILCPILIHYFGIEGAAMATVIGRSSGVAYQCYHLWKGDSVFKIKLRDFGIDLAIIKNVFGIAWPAALQFIIGSGSWILITKLVAEVGGTVASAGYQIAFRIFIFFMLPAWGLSNAAATLMGQNLGAQQFERAESSVMTTAKYAAVFMGIVMCILLALANPIISIFTQDLQVLNYGVEGLRIIAAGFIFFGYGMVLTQALNGAGDTKTPTRFNVICFWLFQTPFAYVLVKMTHMQAAGALVAIPAAHVLLTVLSWRYFKTGRWKSVKV